MYNYDIAADWNSDYDSTWEDEELEPPKRKKQKPQYQRNFGNRAARDMQNYRHGYGKPNLETANDLEYEDYMPNLEFYRNNVEFKPNGMKIEEFHQDWWEEYEELEENHFFIQWLFPLRERGVNPYAKPLTLAEIQMMKADKDVMRRFLESYELILGFYGIQLLDKKTGEVSRAKNWAERFYNLNNRGHNNLRITRILKCLGEMGYEHFQAPLVRFFLEEILCNNNLPNVKSSALDYFMFTVKDKQERRKLVQFAWENYKSQAPFFWGPVKRLQNLTPKQESAEEVKGNERTAKEPEEAENSENQEPHEGLTTVGTSTLHEGLTTEGTSTLHEGLTTEGTSTGHEGLTTEGTSIGHEGLTTVGTSTGHEGLTTEGTSTGHEGLTTEGTSTGHEGLTTEGTSTGHEGLTTEGTSTGHEGLTTEGTSTGHEGLTTEGTSTGHEGLTTEGTSTGHEGLTTEGTSTGHEGLTEGTSTGHEGLTTEGTSTGHEGLTEGTSTGHEGLTTEGTSTGHEGLTTVGTSTLHEGLTTEGTSTGHEGLTTGGTSTGRDGPTTEDTGFDNDTNQEEKTCLILTKVPRDEIPKNEENELLTGSGDKEKDAVENIPWSEQLLSLYNFCCPNCFFMRFM